MPNPPLPQAKVKDKGGRPIWYIPLPQQLKDMREAYQTRVKEGKDGKPKEERPGLETQRALLKSNPEKFMELMRRLEEDYREKLEENKRRVKAKAAAGGGEKLAEDAGAVRMGELVDPLLAEFKQEAKS